jgi:chromosome segregation ATPase
MTISESSLLSWLNSFPEVQALSIPNFTDFRDGFGIATLWNTFGTPKIDPTTLQQASGSTAWIAWMKNLRVIDSVIGPAAGARGVRERCDFAAIARKGQLEDLIKFIKPLILLSLSSPLKKDIIQRIRSLPSAVQKDIRAVIESYQNRKKGETGNETLEDEISELKDQIATLEEEIENLDREAENAAKTEAAGQTELIKQTTESLAEVTDENEELRGLLSNSRAKKLDLRTEIAKLKARAVPPELARETGRKSELVQQLSVLEKSMSEFESLGESLVEMRKKCRKEQARVGKLDQTIASIKDELTTSIQLSHKYGAVTEADDVIENELNESVAELANRISQCEIDLVVLMEAIGAGESGVPPEVLAEQATLKKVISRMLKKKKRLEDENAEKRQLREEMGRIKKLMEDQTAEVEAELDKFSAEINTKNAALTSWLSFSTALESWRQSATFLSALRQKYL